MKVQNKMILWLNCYGHWDPENRSRIATKGYDQYLTAFVKRVISLKNQIEAVYISGGMLNSRGQTECETVKPELERRLKEKGVSVPILVDEESLSTISIAKLFLKTAKEKYSDSIPLLFCDQVRYKTDLYLIDYFSRKLDFPVNAKEVVTPLPRLDDHPDSTYEAQEKKIERMKKEGVGVVEAKQIKERSKKL